MMENLDAQERALLQTFEGTMVSDTVETIITYVPQPDEERSASPSIWVLPMPTTWRVHLII